jgi:WhiB family transcriptional regulator, redox-sensing transcriptional regulator
VDWRSRATCLGADPELFFPVGTTALAGEQAIQAKAVCAGCPVRRECLDWALVTKQDHGVWGGLDEFERRAEHRHVRRHGRSNYGERRLLEYATSVGEIAALTQLPLTRPRLPGHRGLSSSGAGSMPGAGAAEGAGR